MSEILLSSRSVFTSKPTSAQQTQGLCEMTSSGKSVLRRKCLWIQTLSSSMTSSCFPPHMALSLGFPSPETFAGPAWGEKTPLAVDKCEEGGVAAPTTGWERGRQLPASFPPGASANSSTPFWTFWRFCTRHCSLPTFRAEDAANHPSHTHLSPPPICVTPESPRLCVPSLPYLLPFPGLANGVCVFSFGAIPGAPV